MIEDRSAPAPIEFVERVAKLTIEDFRFMFALCGLTIEAVYGDYGLAPFDERTAPRLILVARKTSDGARVELLPARGSCGCG